MKGWVPYIGQEVVSLVDSYQTKKGDTFIVNGVKSHCCVHLIDIGRISPVTITLACKEHYTPMYIIKGQTLWVQSECFAPVEKQRIQYVRKEVEVAPEIASMEVVLS